ncbi:MAG: aquaporin family protein [Bacteroidales bacterium]|jgi:glycerol uptake facilitator protein|nr:aquaporin family protein [Bacteroidales bacterium]MBR6933834.1 aquaporin family protein [Bacteroidales bacterium]
MLTQSIFEFLGTMILVLLGDGVCAACTLNKSKAQGAGWVVITLAWGFAVMCGVFVAGPVSGAHLNPAVTLGLALAGLFPWAGVLPYIVAQMLGGFAGAVLVYAFYVDHFAATSDNPDGMLGCFCTMPAIEHKTVNFFSEFLATFVLVFVIMAIGTKGNTPMAGDVPVGLGAVGAFPVTALIMSLGMSLGATTGYAMNPARDLSPRCAHAILPIRGKRDSGWGYSWIPVFGPLTGGAFAAAIYLILF